MLAAGYSKRHCEGGTTEATVYYC